MDEAVRTRLLERFRKDLDDSRLRGVAKSQYEQELEVLIEALSTGCGAGQHDYAVREGHTMLYCRRCGVVKPIERPGVVDGADAAQTIYRQAQKIEDLRHKVQSQERALSEQRATIEALQGRIDSQVITSAISESERERYVKQIGQLVGEWDRLGEQCHGYLRQMRDRNTQITELKGQLRLAEDAAKSLKAELGTARLLAKVGRTVTVHDPDPELKRRIEELEQQLGRMQVARDAASEQLASLRRSIRGFARQHAP